MRVCVFAQLTYTYAYELTHIVNLIGLQLTILWYNYTYNANYRNFWEIEAHLHMFYYYHYHYCGGRAYNRRGSRCAHQTKPNQTKQVQTELCTEHSITPVKRIHSANQQHMKIELITSGDENVHLKWSRNYWF